MMTKDEFEKQVQWLVTRDYKYSKGIKHPYYYKVIERRDDDNGKSRAVCQLLYEVYDLSQYSDRIESEHLYGLTPNVVVSRKTEELITMSAAYPEIPVEDMEKVASQFMDFVDKNIPEQ